MDEDIRDIELNMETEKKQKKKFRDRIKGFFNKIIKKPAYNEEFDSKYIRSISPGALGDAYADVKRAALLCEQGMKIAGMRASLSNKQQELNLQLSELEKFDSMNQTDKDHISSLVERLTHVKGEKNNLRTQIMSFDRILDYLGPLEEEVLPAVKSMEEAEDAQRQVRQDMNYIEGEKAELEYQKESIDRSLKFIYNISVALFVFFIGVTIFLIVLYSRYNIPTFMWGFFAAVLLIFLSTTLYIFRRRMVFESKLNVLLQIRAVELLNRKKIVYAHHTNFLNFLYKKFRVKSSDMLKNNWQEYGYYKHVTGRYDSVRNIIYTIEDDLSDFLKKNSIPNTKSTVEHFIKILDFDNNRRLRQKLTNELMNIEQKLSPLDVNQEKVWKELLALKERDTTEDQVISNMINEYFDDAENIILLDDEEEEFEIM